MNPPDHFQMVRQLFDRLDDLEGWDRRFIDETARKWVGDYRENQITYIERIYKKIIGTDFPTKKDRRPLPKNPTIKQYLANTSTGESE